MHNIFFDKSRFRELRSNVYSYNDVNEDVKLYKYIDFSALADIMDGNYLVKRRKFFSDRHECGEVDNPFSEHLLPFGQKATYADIKRWDGLKQKRLLSGEIPTSCFTLESEEMFHFWKSFTQTYTGVRISTTLGSFLDALDFSGFELYIGRVNYSNIDISAYDMTKYLFSKKLWYKPETEFRIYFIPKEKMDFRGENMKIYVKSEFISEIVLSPFIPQKLRIPILNFLRSFNNPIDCKVRHSFIKE